MPVTISEHICSSFLMDFGTYRWGDNIRLDIREICCKAVDWIHRDQDKDQWRVFVNTIMDLQVP
jgi:hypothetical protein